MKKKKKSGNLNLLKKPSWVSKINEVWLGVFGLLAVFLYIEWSHVMYHEKAAPHCASEISLAVKL